MRRSRFGQAIATIASGKASHSYIFDTYIPGGGRPAAAATTNTAHFRPGQELSKRGWKRAEQANNKRQNGDNKRREAAYLCQGDSRPEPSSIERHFSAFPALSRCRVVCEGTTRGRPRIRLDILSPIFFLIRISFQISDRDKSPFFIPSSFFCIAIDVFFLILRSPGFRSSVTEQSPAEHPDFFKRQGLETQRQSIEPRTRKATRSG